MKQDVHAFPRLKFALEQMALDNGVINREEPIDKFHEVCNQIIGAEGVDWDDLAKMEEFLTTLSDEQITILVGGEVTEIRVILALAPTKIIGQRLDGLLNDVFESM